MLVAEAVGMEKPLTVRDDNSLIEIVRILVFVQAVIAIVTAIEALLVGTLMGSPTPGVVTGIAVMLTIVFYVGLGRRLPRSRKWLVRFQVGWIIFGTIDLLLAVFLANRGLAMMPMLTRFVLPYAIFRILRKPHVRAEFDPAAVAKPDAKPSMPEAPDFWEEQADAMA